MAIRTTLGLARIARETVQERVYLALRDQLMRGGFEPGQKLKIAELAEAFGTSAMPVREALNRLTVERALETLPSRTVCVPALSSASFSLFTNSTGKPARLADSLILTVKNKSSSTARIFLFCMVSGNCGVTSDLTTRTFTITE